MPGIYPCLQIQWLANSMQHGPRVLSGEGGAVGFSAALLPYLAALHDHSVFKRQLQRLQQEQVPATGLLGNPPIIMIRIWLCLPWDTSVTAFILAGTETWRLGGLQPICPAKTDFNTQQIACRGRQRWVHLPWPQAELYRHFRTQVSSGHDAN